MDRIGPNGFEERALKDATVQELQLELIRRTQFNAMNGAKVVEWLMANRELWRAVILDRPGLRGDVGLSRHGLIKLRDLPQNFWNADTLFVLCRTGPDAPRFAEAFRGEEWGAMVSVYDDEEEVEDALGGSDDLGLVTLWWD